MGGDGHGVEHLVEAGPGVHEVEGLVDEGVEEIGGVGERLADALGAHDGEAVAREQDLGLEADHLAQGDGPLAGVALHLLGVAGVG